MNLADQFNTFQNRRQFLRNSALGLGGMSLMNLSAKDGHAPVPGLAQNASVFPITLLKLRKSFGCAWLAHLHIWICSDYKPTLEKMFDKDLPESVRDGQRLTGMTANQARFPAGTF